MEKILNKSFMVITSDLYKDQNGKVLTDSEKIKRASRLENMLNCCNMEYYDCTGMLNGRKELSYLVIPKTVTDKKIIESFAFLNFGQKSVLIHNSVSNTGYLKFSDGTVTKLGSRVTFTIDDVPPAPNYTDFNGTLFTYIK